MDFGALGRGTGLNAERDKVAFSPGSGFCLAGSSGEVELDQYGRVIKGTALWAIYPSPMKELPLQIQTLDYEKEKDG